MKIGRLEIVISAATIVGSLLGLLWLALSLGLGDAFLAWREVEAWRKACARDQGKFTIDEAGMSCEFPSGSRKSMGFRTPL